MPRIGSGPHRQGTSTTSPTLDAEGTADGGGPGAREAREAQASGTRRERPVAEEEGVLASEGGGGGRYSFFGSFGGLGDFVPSLAVHAS